MQVIERDKQRKSEQKILAAARELRGVRDLRYVHPLAEIQYQAGGRHHAGSRGAERPSTIGGSTARQRDMSKHQGLYAESSSSYFPRINESHITREFREHRAKYNSSMMLPLSARRPSSRVDRSSARSGRQTARGRMEMEMGDSTRDVMSRKERNPSEYRTVSSVAMSLDKQGMEVIFKAFEELETLDEEEFVTEMLQALAADTASEDQRVDLTSQVSDLFRQADLSARGYLTWQDFSTFFSQTSDVVSALEDTVINKYQGDNTPAPVNFVAEIEGLIYLPDIDQVVIHDTRGKGFQSYDVQTRRIRSSPSSERGSGGRIVDAVYSCYGRYIITASTSPVISFYDADQLQIRQQIPTESLQTALAIDYSSQCSKQVVYSACAEGKVHAWDLESLKRQHTFFEKKGANFASAESMMITDLEVLPATSLVACGSMDGKIYMLDVAAGRVAKTLSGHTKGVSLLRYCAENKYLVSGGIDHQLQVWNPHLEQKVGSLPGHRSQLIGLHVRPNSPEVITADESGVMKIWDLRKFAAVQTIVKELYVKNHSASTSRAMTAMCYIESQQRIAIAHSTVFFLDPARPNERASTAPHVHGTNKHEGVNSRLEQPEDDDTMEEEEENKPLEVLFHPPTHCFVGITPWHVVCWEASSGSRIRSTQITLGSEVTCVAVMDDLYSCFVGCDNGSIARLVLPNAAVVVHKPVHRCGEITGIRLSMPQRRILSSGSDGNIIVSTWDTLEPIFFLNHWRGVNSVHTIPGSDDGKANHQPGECYSVPLHLRPFFVGNEIERLKAAFAEADPAGSGSIALSMLPHVLERVFPTSESNANPTSQLPAQCDEKPLTFAMFVEVVQESLTKGILADNAPALAAIASFDAHAKLETLLTTSSSDDSFCVWNLKNGAVVGEVSTEAIHALSSTDSKGIRPPTKRSVSMVVFLYPLPYFICVEENSSQFSVWCSIAMPPLLSKPYECVLAYSLTNAVDLRTRGSMIDVRLRSTFLTESKAGATAPSTAKDELVIRAMRWFVSDRDDKKLLCVGDDRGQIHILDFKAVFRRIEDLKKQAKKSELRGAGDLHEERGRGSLSAAQTSTSPTRELLPSTLLHRLQRWQAHQKYIGIRSIHVLDIENLIQPNANKRAVVISVSDNGAVQLWSLDGQQLGRLLVTGSTDSISARRWRLRVDVDEVKQKNQDSAMSMLKQVEQRMSFSMNQDEEEETRTAVKEILMKNPLLRRPTAESGAGQHRSSPRAQRITKEPQARRTAMTTEDALVAWRRSVQVKQSRPSVTRPWISEPILEDERG